MPRELSVIIPTHRRSAKLRTLLEGIAATPTDHGAFEVVVVVDGRDPAPLEAGALLPERIRFTGLTQEHAGPAAARNHALEYAEGDWVLFFDDDARVESGTIPGHLQRIRANPSAATAYLGRFDWPGELLDSPWRRLLAETSMLFFWDRMEHDRAYGFRHFWTINLSVRRDLVQAVGGFRRRFPSPMHEDIELGWRLQEAFDLQVRVDTSIRSLHDHPLDPEAYFRREHMSGASARAAATINRAFHDQVWPWVRQPQLMLNTLRELFLAPARDVVQRLEAWTEPADRPPSAAELQATYLAHLPLKRIAFLHGYVGRPFAALWDELQGR